MLANSVNDIVFNSPIPPKNNKYKFSVTELIRYNEKDLAPTFEIEVPANMVKFVPYGKKFKLKVDDKAFENLKGRYADEVYVYPAFAR